MRRAAMAFLIVGFMVGEMVQGLGWPPDLVGRVDTISIGSVPKAPELPKASPVERGTAGDRKTPARTGQQAGVIVQDPNLHELVLAMPDSAPPIGATYGTDQGSTRQILTTVRPDGISRKPVIVEQPVMGGQPAKAPAQVKSKPRNPAWPVVTAPPTGVPPGWLPPSDKPAPPASPTPAPTPKPTGPVLASSPVPAPPTTPGSVVPGFDTCAAPSLPTMKAWRAKYAATAIYIGGQMMGCGQSNLSASWIQQAKAMGWALMPTFVGLQAPCDTFSGRHQGPPDDDHDRRPPAGGAEGHLDRAVGQRGRPGRDALRDLSRVAERQPGQAVPGQQDGHGGRYLAPDRRRHGGRPGGAQVGGRSPSRAGRIQFAMTGAGS